MIEKIKKIFEIGVPQISKYYLQQHRQHCFTQKTHSPLSQKQIRAVKQHALGHTIFSKNIKHNHAKIIHDANRITQGILPVFSHTISTDIPRFWHYDPVSNTYGDHTSYYRDITITPNHTSKIKFDIRMSWELSRFHFAYTLGKAYHHTNNKIYAKTFVALLNSWIADNPYLYGIHWTNPMEVGIRSINLIGALEHLKTSPLITDEIWQKILILLHQSICFIEGNWEIYFKPNNHYLTNLLGHYFLCSIFRLLPRFEQKLRRCHKWFAREIINQMLPDGTSYEGSTSYHLLVTEMVYLYLKQAQLLSLPVDTQIKKRFDHMQSLVQDCTVSKDYFVSIGDDDSGHILPHMDIVSQTHLPKEISHYPDFGLTIIQKHDWHITLRHPAYQKHQPTGHFHEDELSITLAYKDIPILIDPGSFIYTGSTQWRNAFRSYSSHNTVHSVSRTTNNIFNLSKEPNHKQPLIDEKNSIVEDSWGRITRTIECHRTQVSIIDTIHSNNHTLWNFIFHPAITLENISPKEWNLIYNGKKLLAVTTSLPLQSSTGWYTGHFGTKTMCSRLISHHDGTASDKRERLTVHCIT